jgi:Protein of unknown function (DUF3800)
LLRHGSVERITLVLNAFIDASEEQPGITVAAMGSWVANEAHWQKFEDRWKLFLARNEIKGRFHASEFLARQGQFNWSEEKHNLVKNEIAQIFNEIGMCGFGVAVNCKAYQEWRLQQKVHIHDDPYYFCLQRMMDPLILWIYEVPKDEGIAIYIDRDNARQKLGESVARWYKDRLRQQGPPGYSKVNPDRDISTHYVSSFTYVGLQAADIAANGAFRHLKHLMKTGERFYIPPIIDGFKRGFGPVQFDIAVFNEPEHFDLWLHGPEVETPPIPSSPSSPEQSS